MGFVGTRLPPSLPSRVAFGNCLNAGGASLIEDEWGMSNDSSRSPVAGPPLTRLATMWLGATEHAFESVLAANRASMAAVGLSNGHDDDGSTETLSYSDPTWQTERSVTGPTTISVGDRVEFHKTIGEDDVEWFAAATGDTNRLHLDDDFASESRFGGRIAHGTLVSGLISAALARLPGLTVYLSQDVRFLMPVELGDELRAVCEVVEALGDDKYRLTTEVYTQSNEQVIDGEAVVLLDELPDTAE